MKIIAMYLPQYHQIPENDLWWGKGYTEWTAVKNAKPMYKGHQQPRIPIDENYYDLSDESAETWKLQAETARKYGLAEGSRAILRTPKGEIKIRAHLFEGVPRNLIAVPRGLGHTGYDKYISSKGANVNEVIGTIEDPASGHDAAWGIAAQLIKA